LRRQRDLARETWTTPEARYGFPAWWLELLRGQYPDNWEAIVASENRHPPMTLRVNRRRTTVPDYLARLQAAQVEARHLGDVAVRIHPRPVFEVPGFAEGLASVQDAGAQWAARLLDVADGQRVLDACAAPGGKTGHLLEIADLDLVAIDSDTARLGRIRENLDRLGGIATLVCADAAKPETWWDGRPFQRILLDAPCSASGVARRHPDIRWNRRPSDLARFAAQQAALLDGVWQVLETSGKLLYATCSIFARENKLALAAFLRRHDDAVQIGLSAPGMTDGQLLPNDEHDGFFYALLQKKV
jgi:16S rRNA (cytosine967-C5)-methyltransferase